MLTRGNKRLGGEFDSVISLLIDTGEAVWLSSMPVCLVTSPGGGCIKTWWQRRCQWRCSEIKSTSIQLQKQPSTPSVKWQQRVSHACLHRNMFMVGGWWSVELLSPIKCDKSGPKSYCDDSRVSREIRFENLDKIWIRQVIVYQHCVLTGEKKTASYLWIFGYTWLILILFLHYANL